MSDLLHVNKGKLEPRAKTGVFVIYENGVKGFQIWYSSERKVMQGRDVTFDGISILNSKLKKIQTRQKMSWSRWNLKAPQSDIKMSNNI